MLRRRVRRCSRIGRAWIERNWANYREDEPATIAVITAFTIKWLAADLIETTDRDLGVGSVGTRAGYAVAAN